MQRHTKHILCLIGMVGLMLFGHYLKADTTTITFIGVKPKAADTIQYLNIFTQYLWDVKLYKAEKEVYHAKECSPDTLKLIEKADKIKLTTIFELDSSLLNKTFVFGYQTEGSLLVKLNQQQILKIEKPLKKNHFARAMQSEEGFVDFIPTKNLITFEIIIKNSVLDDISFQSFKIGTVKWKDKKINDKTKSEKNSLTILFFYLAFGIVMLVQYLFFRKSTENLYFSLFCLCFAFFQLNDFFQSNELFNLVFFSFAIFALEFLACYLSIVLSEKSRKKYPLVNFTAFITLTIIFSVLIPYPDVTVKILMVCYYFYIGFLCIYLLFQGGIKRKWEVKYLSYGFFLALILFIIIFIAAIAFNMSPNESFTQGLIEKIAIIALFIIPVTIAVIIGKRNGINQQDLAQQLKEIEKLSIDNLKNEKEKQIILESQNVILEEKVIQRTKELIRQKEIVEHKNREITDSIEYALRIQTAILPPQRLVKQYLENSFILYKPKDIVAGDFYWMETLQLAGKKSEQLSNVTIKQFDNEKNQLILFAACDCTGHGVPGAMVSVVCYNALNRAVHEFGLIKPADILNKIQEIVLENFSKSEEEIKDGMDISLCCLIPNPVTDDGKISYTLQWAGANNPLWIVRKNENNDSNNSDVWELYETKANKQPIGMNEDTLPFTNHTFTLNSGDLIYIFSDGFADQFSPADKKLMKKNFKELLLSIQNKSMLEQYNFLNNYIESWKGNMEQTDDILVMGVRV